MANEKVSFSFFSSPHVTRSPNSCCSGVNCAITDMESSKMMKNVENNYFSILYSIYTLYLLCAREETKQKILCRISEHLTNSYTTKMSFSTPKMAMTTTSSSNDFRSFAHTHTPHIDSPNDILCVWYIMIGLCCSTQTSTHSTNDINVLFDVVLSHHHANQNAC